MSYVVGIDPGVHGGIAVFDPKFGRLLSAHDIPVYSVKGKDRVDLHGLSRLFSLIHEEARAVFIERVGAMPGQGVSSMFRFGEAYGMLQAMAVAYGFTLDFAEPAIWKKAIGLRTRDKDESRQLASRMLPEAAPHWPLKKHHGRAEAALLAVYGARRLAFQKKGYAP